MRLQSIFSGERSESSFGFSFIAATASYSILTSWLGILRGLPSFIGGFVVAYIVLGMLSYFEDRRHIEFRRGERMEKLLRHVAKSHARDEELLEIADSAR